MNQKLKAIIFDMDGVLIDSEPLHFEAYRELISSYGSEYTLEYNQQFLGQKDVEIAPKVIKDHNLPLSTKQFVIDKDKIFHALIKKSAAPLAGVTKTLKTARDLNFKVGLASSSKMETIQLIVKTLNLLPYFDSLTSGDEVAKGKPAPDVFLLAAKRLATEPTECLVIEDTDAGVMAAKSAKMFCVAIPCQATIHQKHLNADMKLESMDCLDLKNLVLSK